MTSPDQDTQTAGGAPPSAVLPFSVLKKRGDFVKAARGRKTVSASFILQARQRSADESNGIRVGFTTSKKVGNAVARNHARRRLREIARLVIPTHGSDGFDYVLIGRAGRTGSQNFATLQDELRKALATLHGSEAK